MISPILGKDCATRKFTAKVIMRNLDSFDLSKGYLLKYDLPSYIAETFHINRKQHLILAWNKNEKDIFK